MKRAIAEIDPKLLNFEQKLRRMGIAQEMLMTINGQKQNRSHASITVFTGLGPC